MAQKLKVEKLATQIAGAYDAAYTADSYDFNDPRRVRLRRLRRTTISDRPEFIERAPQIRDRLLDRAAEKDDPELIEAASLIEKGLRLAWQDLEYFQVLPVDLERPCACGDELLCCLPAVLEEQTLEIEFPFSEPPGGADPA